MSQMLAALFITVEEPTVPTKLASPPKTGKAAHGPLSANTGGINGWLQHTEQTS
jgi:hypothetical protein